MCLRERKKSAEPSSSLSRPTTRTDVKKSSERRLRNKEAQSRRRAKMSSQKKRREREKSNMYYWKKKEEQRVRQDDMRKKLEQRIERAVRSPQKTHYFATPEARRAGVYRVKKLFNKNNFLGSLSATVRSAFQQAPKDMESMGIAYSSPTKNNPAANSNKQTNPQTLNTALDFMKNKKDKETLRCKRILLDAAKKISSKYSSATALYSRKKQDQHQNGQRFPGKSIGAPSRG